MRRRTTGAAAVTLPTVAVRAAVAVAVRAGVRLARGPVRGERHPIWADDLAARRAFEGACTLLYDLAQGPDDAGPAVDREVTLWAKGGVSLGVVDSIAARVWPAEWDGLEVEL